MAQFLAWYGTKAKGGGRHWRNGGSYGADHSGYAATWDEWGWWMVELYRRDPDVVIGHYRDRAAFDELTRGKFTTAASAAQR